MRTVRDWLRYGEERLGAGPHPARARADAEALLIGSLAVNRAWLMAHRDDPLDAGDAGLFRSRIGQRAAGWPIQYIEQTAGFYGLTLEVTPDVLIPRPETEILVERAIALAAALERPRILDVGTGSGAIALALARHLPHAEIVATDLSRAALEVAAANARRNELEGRIRLLEGDLLAPVEGEGGGFDLIVSNPPYVPEADRASLAVEVRDFEPALALFAGEDGLEVYRRLIPAALRALVPGGVLLGEIGYGQSEPVRELAAGAGLCRIVLLPDLQGIARVLSAERPSPAGR